MYCISEHQLHGQYSPCKGNYPDMILINLKYFATRYAQIKHMEIKLISVKERYT